jgi:cholesterol 7-dehydrogenase
LYTFLFGRFERYLPITDAGFEFPTKRISKGLVSKHEIMNEVRRRKRMGDLPPVYPNGWFGLLRSEEVAVGASTAVDALGQNFAVFRDEEGKIHILDAYCAHLGANIAVGGKVYIMYMHAQGLFQDFAQEGANTYKETSRGANTNPRGRGAIPY